MSTSPNSDPAPENRVRLRRRRVTPGFSISQVTIEHVPLSSEALTALIAHDRETSLKSEVGQRIFKTSVQLALCLFAALACQAFGLALFCLFLAGWEARDVCELIDAPA